MSDALLSGRVLKSESHFLAHLPRMNYTKRGARHQGTSTMLPGRLRSHERMSHREPHLPRKHEYRASPRHGPLHSLGTGRRITIVLVSPTSG
ncbi:hypothetical protein CHARACLAT_011871 [Characodon lateralis]|uniref:Uncharacterized protein n=1 Tax=Characodon lateralis TaxID=208331 RepID=A0ABU7ET49_9TELE|nr:hypothetical protein [Characodon lateralis]